MMPNTGNYWGNPVDVFLGMSGPDRGAPPPGGGQRNRSGARRGPGGFYLWEDPTGFPGGHHYPWIEPNTPLGPLDPQGNPFFAQGPARPSPGSLRSKPIRGVRPW